MLLKKFWDKARTDQGSASLEFITAGMLLLVPVVYLVMAVSAVQGATLATEGAARHAARVYVQAANQSVAKAQAQHAVNVALADFGIASDNARVNITCASSCLTPRALVTVSVAVDVPMPLVPKVLNLHQLAVVPVSAQASELVSKFRAGAR